MLTDQREKELLNVAAKRKGGTGAERPAPPANRAE
jgi:hypothetical protein